MKSFNTKILQFIQYKLPFSHASNLYTYLQQMTFFSGQLLNQQMQYLVQYIAVYEIKRQHTNKLTTVTVQKCLRNHLVKLLEICPTIG